MTRSAAGEVEIIVRPSFREDLADCVYERLDRRGYLLCVQFGGQHIAVKEGCAGDATSLRLRRAPSDSSGRSSRGVGMPLYGSLKGVEPVERQVGPIWGIPGCLYAPKVAPGQLQLFVCLLHRATPQIRSSPSVESKDGFPHASAHPAREMKGWDYDDIAHLMGVSRATLGSYLTRARKDLRRKLQPPIDSPSMDRQ
jgi:hypothetical protein